MTRHQKRLTAAAFIAGGMLAGGVLSLHVLADHYKVVLEKKAAPLQRPLADLPSRLGPWRQMGHDQRLQPEVVQILGTRRYLLRNYRLKGFRPPAVGLITLNLNYYSKGNATPHVPNVCWKGVGRKRIYDHMITVRHVRHADGSYSNIPMRFLSFAAPEKSAGDNMFFLGTDQHRKLINVAYTFQVNGQYVANTEQVTQLFWNATSQYGYHAKIEVDVAGLTQPAAAEVAIKNFIRSALPQIERCLPDWKKLNAQKFVINSRGREVH